MNPILCIALCATYFSKAGAPPLLQSQEKPSVVISTQKQYDLAAESQKTLSETSLDAIQLFYNDKFYVVEKESCIIYTSHKVVPIEAYRNSVAWMKSVMEGSETQFSLNTETGRELYRLFATKMLGSMPDQSSEAFMSVAPGFKISDKSGKLSSAQVDLPISSTKPLAYPLRLDFSQISNKDEVLADARKSDTIFPTLHMEADEIRIDIADLKETKALGIQLFEVGETLGALGLELEEAQKQYNVTFDSFARDLLRKSMGEFQGKLYGDSKFNDFPTGVKDLLRSWAESNPALLGFQTSSDASRYLDSNPELELTFYLNFQMNMTQKRGDETTKTGVNLIIGNKREKH